MMFDTASRLTQDIRKDTFSHGTCIRIAYVYRIIMIFLIVAYYNQQWHSLKFSKPVKEYDSVPLKSFNKLSVLKHRKHSYIVVI